MDRAKLIRALSGEPMEDPTRRSGLAALNPVDEMGFQKWATALPWYEQFSQKYGEAPNLNDPQYDYRKAYASGVSPQPYQHDPGMDHWPSTTDAGDPLKVGAHPTAWMNDFLGRTGVDPNQMGVTNPEDAAAYVGNGRNFMRLPK
jgi:hypothetical protein